MQFLNTLPDQPGYPKLNGYANLLLTLHHRRSGEEMCVDALLPDDSLRTVLDAIHKHYPGWAFYESLPIEQPEFAQPIAA